MGGKILRDRWFKFRFSNKEPWGGRYWLMKAFN